MQPTVVMAFRKRLKGSGYKDICIKMIKDSNSRNYLVTAVEPLASVTVKKEYTLTAMHNSFR